MSLERVVIEANALLARVRAVADRGEISWKSLPPPEDVPPELETRAYSGIYGTPTEAFLTVMSYIENGHRTSRGMVAATAGLFVPIYPPLADILTARAEAYLTK